MSRTLQIPPPILAILSLCLFLGWAAPAWGQSSESCDALTDEVYRVFQEGNHDSVETLRRITATAGRAEACYEEERTPRRIWLREMRIWSSDQLGRRTHFVENYALASRLAEAFWEDFGQAATPASKANVARFLIRFRSFQGDFEGAQMALDTARHYIDALAIEDQFQVRLTGASLFHDNGQHRRAAGEAWRVLAQVAHATEGGEHFVRARARHIRAEALVEIEEEKSLAQTSLWPGIIADLKAAAEGFEGLSMRDRQSAALAGLAEAYARAGRAEQSEAYLDTAFTLAQQEVSPKPEILALLHRGRIRAYQGRLDEAEADFDRGLVLSDAAGIGKHTYDLMYERARLDEVRRALRPARARYARLARLSVPFADGGVRAAALRREAAYRAADIERLLLRRERLLLRLSLAALVLLALATLFVAVESRKRLWQEAWRRALLETLSETSMLRYVYETVHHPHEVAAQIRGLDRGLARRLDRGRLRGKMELYQCLALLIFAVEGWEISQDGVRINLQRYFKRNDWDWPGTPEAWKAHFLEHPIG